MKNLSVRKIILTLVLAVLNVVSNLIANLTVEGGWRIIWLVLGIGALAAIAYILIRNILNPPHVSVQFDQAVPIRQEEYQRHARKGLILLLSDFKPNPGSPAHHLSEKERLELAEKGDYDSLHLTDSNFNPAIIAVTAHASNLSHCWIITTSNTSERNQSRPYARVLAAYLQTICGAGNFHHGDGYVIPAQDDDAMAKKTYTVVNAIYQEARGKFQLRDEDIVSDFTGTSKSMSMGMILACLDRRRTLQYVGSHYDSAGNRQGDSFPILFTFAVKDIEE